MKVIFFSAHDFDKKYFDLHNIHEFDHTYIKDSIDINTVKQAKNHNVVCVFANDKLDKGIIEYLSEIGIELIALRSSGFDNVDLATAKKHNIPVVRVPVYSPNAIAEHAVAMLLTLNRKIHKAYNQVKERNFSLDNLLGYDLCNKTVGIIGSGRIGSVFARIMLGFGCKVVIYDPIVNKDLINQGAQYANIQQLLNESDIISLHCPLNESSFHIINEETIKQMKPGVCLINTGRGGLINTLEVKKGLLNGTIGQLGMDVYECEKSLFFKNWSNDIIHDSLISELLMYPNVLITSHQGFFTHEALTEIAKITIQNIQSFSKGKIQNQITS